MKFAHLYQAVHFEPWLIEPTAHAAIAALLDRRLAEPLLLGDDGVLARIGIGKPDGKTDLFGNPLPEMSVADGVARIPVMGTIGKGLGALEKSCGACSIDDVQGNVREAMNRPDVKGVLLDVNSPGGTIGGIPETAALIQACAAAKPVVSYIDGIGGSAAYWLASQATMVMAAPSAKVGSIGVYMPWVDRSRAAEMQGVKVDVIRNTGGTHKGMGVPGTSLTEAQRAHLQEQVDELFGMFKGSVLAARPNVAADALTGKTFLAATALGKGLSDDTGDYARAEATLRALAGLR